ncbi:MAG: type II toxin-antitoxin system VapB family antitoxin [Pseudonocardiaceae bacterium]
MALSIKSDEVDCLARELAAETGESLTEAVVTALRERLVREHARRGPRMSVRLRRLQSDVALLSVLDPRAPGEILGYDDNGLPEWPRRPSECRYGLVS